MPVFYRNQLSPRNKQLSKYTFKINQFKDQCCGDALWVEVNAGLFFQNMNKWMN